jgi:hypothetical protein
MQAATGKHAMVVDREPADRNLNAVSDAFSTHFLAAVVPGTWPQNDVGPLKLSGNQRLR